MAIDLARVRERRSTARTFRAAAPASDSFDRDYWLAHCEGFRVDAEDGRIGFVDEVRRDSASGETLLAVRAGRLGRQVLLFPTSTVAFIVPRELRLWLRAPEPISGEFADRARLS